MKSKKKKKTGSYYTPPFLSAFILKHIDLRMGSDPGFSILEPSVGDGEFLRAFSKSKLANRKGHLSFTCIEKIKPEIEKAKSSKTLDWACKVAFKFENADFLKWQPTIRKRFSLIIGNPPYIQKKLLKNTQVDICKTIHAAAEIPQSTVKNIWSSFLIRCTQLLKPNGIIALVLPAELLQAKFAKPIREYITSQFDRTEIFTFEELLFDSIGQDTIVLLGYKKCKDKGIYYTSIKNKEQLSDNSFTLSRNDLLVKLNIKLTHHILSGDEIEFLTKLKKKLNPVSSYCTSKPGIVSAANKFFIVDLETEKQFGLHRYSEPIIQKGLYVNGSVTFNNKDLRDLQASGHPFKFLRFESRGHRTFSKSVQSYLRLGIKEGIHKRFKCEERDHWFAIPNFEEPPEGFFFKRCHHYPKLLRNSAKVLVTDSAYEIAMKKDCSIEGLIFSFYNSLSLCFAEMEGRYYGGGVLELTPNEFKSIPIPFSQVSKRNFQAYTSFFEGKSSINDVLDRFDSEILCKELEISTTEIVKIRSIRDKLIAKRLRP